MTNEIRCPQCGSKMLYKDGLRYLADGNAVQRWLCRSCGYRFSDPSSQEKNCNNLDMLKHVQKIQTLNLKTSDTIHTNCQVGVRRKSGAKNLAEVETRIKERAAGATEIDSATVKGKIVEFSFWLQKQGYAEGTFKKRAYIIRRLAELGSNILDPESVKEVLARQPWSESYKATIVVAYNSFLEMLGLKWEPPNYKIQQTLAFIPTEAELDQLINGCAKTLAAFLQGLKDTGADPTELLRIKWVDINEENRTLRINNPVKGHNPRFVNVSTNFINRIKRLPKKGERIFTATYGGMQSNFRRQRKRIAENLGNPRLLKIHFTTFRHWKGTMEYHRTRDLLYVQQILGHKSIQNTMVYIQYEKALYGTPVEKDFIVKVATNVEEACKLIQAGFEYVTGEYNDGGKIFRKRK
ncbi:MAG: tyrosine-type recombinase/integrase [Candidatus Bathyarchaeales archaeon]